MQVNTVFFEKRKGGGGEVGWGEVLEKICLLGLIRYEYGIKFGWVASLVFVKLRGLIHYLYLILFGFT